MKQRNEMPIKPLSDDDWPAEIDEMLSGFAGKLNVYRTMAHNPALMRAWSDLREHIVRGSSLGEELSEVVILRTGFQHGSEYEWVHHVVRGHDAGLSLDRIESLRGDTLRMRSVDAAIATAVDELLKMSRMSLETQTRLAAYVGTKGVLDVIATVGFYSTLAFIINSFSTPIDGEVVDRFGQLQH